MTSDRSLEEFEPVPGEDGIAENPEAQPDVPAEPDPEVPAQAPVDEPKE